MAALRAAHAEEKVDAYAAGVARVVAALQRHDLEVVTAGPLGLRRRRHASGVAPITTRRADVDPWVIGAA